MSFSIHSTILTPAQVDDLDYDSDDLEVEDQPNVVKPNVVKPNVVPPVNNNPPVQGGFSVNMTTNIEDQY